MRACVCYDSMCVHIHVCMCGCVCMCVFHDSEKVLSCDSYFVCHKTQDGLDVFFVVPCDSFKCNDILEMYGLCCWSNSLM